MASAEFPYDVIDVESNLNKQLLEDFHGEKTGFVQVGPKKYFLPVKYRDFAADFYNFELRSDDIWIVTYPRSGTTLMQEMLWQVAYDLDFEAAAHTHLFSRSPFLEFNIVVHEVVFQDLLQLVKGDEKLEAAAHAFASNRIPVLQAASSPRIIKSHLPLTLLPPKLLHTCKTVYMARNPKDVAVSYYHHNRLITTQGYVGDFPKYWNYFQQDLLPWSPYWEHLAEAWKERNNPNMLFLFYEDFVKDPASVVQRVACFLGKDLDMEKIQRLTQLLEIDNFRKHTEAKSSSLPGLTVQGEEGFIRKGKNHGWTSYFTPEMNEQADKWIEENVSRIHGFKFPSSHL